MRFSLMSSLAALVAATGLAAAQDAKKDATQDVKQGPKQSTAAGEAKSLPPASDWRAVPLTTPSALTGPSNVLPPGSFSGARPSDPTGGRFWFSTEYLMWWNKSSPSPPLAVVGQVQGGPTTRSPNMPVPTAPGFIGLIDYAQAGPTIDGKQFGNSLDASMHSGVRFSAGAWLDNTQTWGIEGTYLLMGNSAANFNMTAQPGSTAIGVPYVDPINHVATYYPIAQFATTTTIHDVSINTTPDVFVRLYTQTVTDTSGGNLAVRDTNFLQGGELNAVWNPMRGGNWTMQGLFGLRYLQFDERLTVDASTTLREVNSINYEPALGLPTGAIPVVNDMTAAIARHDIFSAANSFYGGQIGARGEYRIGSFSLLLGAKIAAGDMHQTMQIDGATNFLSRNFQTQTMGVFLAGIPLTVAQPGGPMLTVTSVGSHPGGIFAQPTNIGHYNRDRFAIVPEANLKVGYRFTDRIMATVGYSFLYLSSVARPAELVDRQLTPGSLAVPAATYSSLRPAFYFHGADYWAQGVDIGLQYRY